MAEAKRYDSVFRTDMLGGARILVTGGGTGIGRCIAHELAALGAHVVIAARREEPLLETASEIRAAGGRVDHVVLNIRDEVAVDSTVKRLVEEFGAFSGLVNNAGGQFASPAAMIRAKGWRAVVDTNLNGTWFVSQAMFSHSFSRHKRGSIVNIVADMFNGFPGMAHTGAARAGVVNLTKTLAIEWAPAGVRVNAVAPGFILSSGLKNYPAAIQQLAAQVMVKNPSSRLGSESEVASAVTFLLSAGASYISGVTLRVDGCSSLQKVPMVPQQSHQNLPAYNGFHLAADLPEIFK